MIVYYFLIGCGTSRMSSIPMGAHAAFKVRNTLNANGDRFGDKQQQPSVGFSNADGEYLITVKL